MIPPETEPVQTTYPMEFIKRAVTAIPANGRLHTQLVWNMAGIKEQFEDELLHQPHTDEEWLAIRHLYEEQRQLATTPFVKAA